jgi:chitinase
MDSARRRGASPTLSVAALAVALLLACGGGGSSAPGDATATPTPSGCAGTTPTGFRVVGYMPSWQGDVGQIDFAKLTHLLYAFALPTAQGGLRPVDDLPKLQTLVARAHAQGVKVLISIGGWNDGDDSAFTALAASASGRRNFAASVSDFVAAQGLDGADIDWEVPEPEERADYAAMIHELSLRLRPAGKLLTAAVAVTAGWGTAAIGSETYPDFDWLNLMAYDGGNGADHSPYAYAVGAIDFWSGRGLPREKTVLGVPFYSRPGWRSYAWLVANYPDAPNHDEIGGEFYNGIATIQSKTCLARQRGGGIMIWELSQDTHDSTSLLAAVARARE